ncbi:MAG TPA: M4 family metallopeptidase [Solirubrobacteraceae bacterium]
MSRSRETGKVTFIRTEHGKPMRQSASGGPPEHARAFLRANGRDFGLRGDGSDVEVTEVREPGGGRSSVRLRQTHRGVPVLSGELIVNLDADGNVLSASGEASPDLDVDTRPRTTPAAARDTALAATAQSHGVPAGELTATQPRLAVYDNRLLGGPGLDRPLLVWELEVRGDAIREAVFVDARHGNVALNYSEIAESRRREICDAADTSTQNPCVDPVRLEGEGATRVADVNRAYNVAGVTYDFYRRLFGRDSLDGRGMSILSTVRYCTSQCPLQNAYWNGTQTLFGTGWATDDVVGHELTHGVTEHTSNLRYYFQSGAINESLSDVFGEFIDFDYATAADTAEARWLVTEDKAGGAIRDMEDPTQFSDPDRMTSSYYTLDYALNDAGGVHTNSGVNNKAAFLMTDGGTFNGYTIAGIGATRAARVYYEAQSALLTSGSDYLDLSNALRQACANLQGSFNITAQTCLSVSRAVLAVEMDVNPPKAPTPSAPRCDAGTYPRYSFSDDFEGATTGRWTETGAGYWSYDTGFATSGDFNLRAAGTYATGDGQIAMTSAVPIPSGAYLAFNHAFNFDGYSSAHGAVVEYSADGGPWTDAGSLARGGGWYPGTVQADDNPLYKREAFVNRSYGMGAKRLSLAPLAGRSVRFRFRMGTSEFGVKLPEWFIDDVGIYTCSADGVAPHVPAPRHSLRGGLQLGTDTTGPSLPATVSWGAGSDDRTPAGKLTYQLQRSVRGGDFVALTGWRTGRTFNYSLTPAYPTRFRVLVRDEAGNVGTATGPSFSPRILQDDDSRITFGREWLAPDAMREAYGGSVRATETEGAVASTTFTGARNVGVVMPNDSTLGFATVCLYRGRTQVDCPTIDLDPLSTSLPRKLVFSRTSLDPAATYTIEVSDARGRIELDAIVIA